MGDFFSLLPLLCCCLSIFVLAGGGVVAIVLTQRRNQSNGPVKPPSATQSASPAAKAAAPAADGLPGADVGLTLEHFTKYTVLAMLLPKLHRSYRDISTPTFMAWADSWLRPHFELNYHADQGMMSLYLPAAAARRTLFSDSLRLFPMANLVSANAGRFNEQQKLMLARAVDQFEVAGPEPNPVEQALLDEDFEETSAIAEKTEAKLRALWDSRTTDRPADLAYDEASLLIKYLALASLLPQVETGRLNLAFYTFTNWTSYWLPPNLALFTTTQDSDAILLLQITEERQGPLCRTPLFHMYESIIMAQRFAALSDDDRESLVAVAGQYLAALPVPPVSHKEGDAAAQEYAEVIESLTILRPPLKLAEKATGIVMIDTGAAGLWPGVQLLKGLLASIFINDAGRGQSPVPGASDPSGTAHWCTTWLRPHWELEVVPDNISMTLYPVAEDGTREPLYFQGPIAAFASPESPIVRDGIRLDYSKRLNEVARQLRLEYGRAVMSTDGDVTGEGLVAISLDDPQLTEKVAHNDDHIFGYVV